MLSTVVDMINKTFCIELVPDCNSGASRSRQDYLGSRIRPYFKNK